MGRYLVFAGECQQPNGGWDDYAADANSLICAMAIGYRMLKGSLVCNGRWAHVVDTEQMVVVWEEDSDWATREVKV